jgi:hypothetical protein
MAKANLMDYDKALELYEVVIGLEVHVELNTNTKMFCGCKNDFGDEPNTNVCPICIGLPGSLPVVNRKAVESSISIGLALGCQITPTGGFSAAAGFIIWTGAGATTALNSIGLNQGSKTAFLLDIGTASGQTVG